MEIKRRPDNQRDSIRIDELDIPQSDTYQHQYTDKAKSKNKANKSGEGPFDKRIKKGAGIFAAVAVAAAIVFTTFSTSSTVTTGQEATEALNTHVSTTLGAGTRLLSKDEGVIGQDYTIAHSSGDGNTVIQIWDYAAEDGDYVQVFVDGAAICDPFMIKNKAVSLSVPSKGVIEVVGTRDGGGGITYAVYYDVNQTTYFNGMEEGGSNTYTLVLE